MKSYNVYLGLPGAERDPWECTATSMGYERVPPGSPYPPRRHPIDHHINWENGRVLAGYQFVYVIDGRGIFESDVSTKRFTIEAGTVMILFPGVWHRNAKSGGSNNGSNALERHSIGLLTQACCVPNVPFCM